MKRYQIADLAVDMAVSGRTERQAAAYAAPANGPADITVSCDARSILSANPEYETLDMAEYLGSGVIFSRQLLDFDGSYLHSSAVILEGKAYLFTAPSGTGKSTHTEKWQRLFGATCLNDDKPAIRLVNGVWMAYGTPWSGKHDLSVPEGVPIGGIAFVFRSEENKIFPMEPAKAVTHLSGQSLWYLTREMLVKQLGLMDKLIRMVPVWELHCRNDDEAAYISHAAMTHPEVSF